ncbi:protoporphyrinogen oxidase [Longilinea arvoryzae]|uniref:Protoporphyrinogen oxidase n=1 Tax=Longilinea arvoryzae TaxID=360412 RepID=A0A0S7BIP0_9CHLR|nr:NAD(P)/FAD-dependent oxidoreductase [Longilinea arvoryzae]GAP15629.1 protoporphyrinogen oxidase [Longilinea arvoryzae]
MKIAVIGAGIGGMAAAYDFLSAGHEVTLLESADYVGGLAAGFKEPNWKWSVERFYHHWFQSDAAILGLIRELGWENRVLFPRPYTVMYYNGKFYPFDSIPAAILYPGLGYGINKIRFGLVGLYLRLTNNWKPLEGVTVDQWMRKWAGDKVYEEMWEPMVVGKFGERYAKEVNMAWLWARLKSRTTRLGTYQGGFQQFADDLADALRRGGAKIRLSTVIEHIEAQPDGRLALNVAGSGVEIYDRVLSTTFPAVMARMAPSLAPDYLQGLLNLKSMGAVVMVLALRHQLSEKGYYWYNLPKKAGFPFLALVEHTNYLPAENYGGDHIVYCGDYLETDHEYFRLSQEELLQRFLPALERINPNFKPDWVRKSWVWKTNYAQPVPLLNHSRNIPDLKTPIPGLYYASMSQVYPMDRGTNYAVLLARRAAKRMLTEN